MKSNECTNLDKVDRDKKRKTNKQTKAKTEHKAKSKRESKHRTKKINKTKKSDTQRNLKELTDVMTAMEETIDNHCPEDKKQALKRAYTTIIIEMFQNVCLYRLFMSFIHMTYLSQICCGDL